MGKSLLNQRLKTITVSEEHTMPLQQYENIKAKSQAVLDVEGLTEGEVDTLLQEARDLICDSNKKSVEKMWVLRFGKDK